MSYLVLEILCCYERIQEILPAWSQHSLDFTTGATTCRVEIESLPKMVDAVFSRFCSRIDQYTNVGLQNFSKSLKEPSVGIDLLLILFLQAKQDLHWNTIFSARYHLDKIILYL